MQSDARFGTGILAARRKMQQRPVKKMSGQFGNTQIPQPRCVMMGLEQKQLRGEGWGQIYEIFREQAFNKS